MKVVEASAIVLRFVVLASLSWALVGLVAPGTPDPFTVLLAWLALIVVVLAIPPSRRFVVRWVGTGRLRPRADT